MAQRRNAHCNCCGRHRDVAGVMSRSGLCPKCSELLKNENIDGLHFKQGAAWQRYLRAMDKFVQRERLALTRLTP